MHTRHHFLLAALTLSVLVLSTQGAWRGNGSGLFPDATPPPVWSGKENIVWSTPLPAWGNGSVTKHEQMIFITAEPHSLLCYDARNGAQLWRSDISGESMLSDEDRKRWDAAADRRAKAEAEWQKLDVLQKRDLRQPGNVILERQIERQGQIHRAAREKIKDVPEIPQTKGHEETGTTSPTPVVDVQRQCVYTLFANGILAAHNFEGRRLWAVVLEMGDSEWGHTSTPVLTKRRLIVCHGNTSGIDPDTGETVWSRKSTVCYGTPVVTNVGDTRVVITPSGQCLRTADGGVVCDNLPTTEFNSPVVHKSIVYYMGIDDTRATAYGLPRQTFTPTKALKIWETPLREGHYYASPVLHRGLLFGLRQSGRLFAINAKSGEKVKVNMFDDMHKSHGQCYASLALAGKHLYLFSDNGTVLAVRPDKTLALAKQFKISKMRGNPFFEGNRVYLRSMTHLVCVGVR